MDDIMRTMGDKYPKKYFTQHGQKRHIRSFQTDLSIINTYDIIKRKMIP